MKILFILFALLSLSCQSESKNKQLVDGIVLKKLQLKQVNENTLNIILPNGKEVQIVNDTIDEISYVSINGGEETALMYYLVIGYIADIYWIEHPKAGNNLLIESHYSGTSGLAASITNVSMINIRDNNLTLNNFNSFHWSIDKLNTVKDTLEIEIIDLHNRTEELYCSTSFYLISGKLKSKGQSLCYALTEKGLIHVNTCDKCIPHQVPFVME